LTSVSVTLSRNYNRVLNMSKNTNKFSPRLYAEGLNVIGDNLL
jgi:hypothetical protein